MKIYLIRHGETTADIENRYGGDYDDELTARGVEQAEELTIKLKDKNIEYICHSPKTRVIQTVEILSKAIKCGTEEFYNLRERNGYGVLTGLTKVEAKEQYPNEVNKLANKGNNNHDILNSESYEIFKKRVLDIFEKIFDTCEYSAIAIVTHGGVIRAFMREYMNLGEFKSLGDCAVIELERKNAKINLISINNAELE